MIKLLLVEDDEVLGFIIKEGMELIGEYDVFWANNPLKALEILDTFKPDVIVSDIEMPGMTGLDFARKVKVYDDTIPIILETAVSSSKTILEAYAIGIDNYIKKPFLPDELDAYIQGLLKRIGYSQEIQTTQMPKDESIIQLGNIRFNTVQQSLDTPEGVVHLSTREAGLIELLHTNLNQLVTREDIAEAIWGGMKYFTPQRMDVFIYSIRKYLASDKHVQIKTMRGVGYMLSIE